MRSPSRPTSVSLSVKSGSELRVTWSPPLDDGGDAIVRYRIDYATSVAGGSGALVNPISVDLTYIPDSGPYTRVLGGLTLGTPYFVRVVACNTQGCGEAGSSTPAKESPRQLPKAPISVRLRATSATSLTVQWEPPTNDGGDTVSQYRIEWDNHPEFEGTGRLPDRGMIIKSAPNTVNTVRFGDLSTTIADLRPGQVYYVRVAAGNRVGFGLPSYDSPAGVAPVRIVPGSPSSLGVTAASAGGLCRSIMVRAAPPQVPSHGLMCGGYYVSDTNYRLGTCPPNDIADGGSAVTGYVVQYSSYSDFRDVVTDGGSIVFNIPVGQEAQTHDLALGPTTGANLQLGQTYFIRVATRTAAGTGPFCDKDGPLCFSGAALSRTPGSDSNAVCN
jgi:hypothetical protein